MGCLLSKHETLGSAAIALVIGCTHPGTNLAQANAGATGNGSGGSGHSGGNTTSAGAPDAGGSTTASGGDRAGTATGGTATAGSTSPTGGASPAGGTTTAGSTLTTGGTAATSCAWTIPTQTCNLAIDTKGYITAGSLNGYTFAWKSETSNGTTSVNSPCISTNCAPPSVTSAICVTGNVTADTTFHSAAGLGFYLSQNSGGTVGATAIPNSITITTYAGSGTGNSFLRVQLTDNVGNDYCVMENTWVSGASIPITRFNTACWNNSGTYATSSMPFQELDLIVPSTGSGDRPFDFCLLDVTIQ
jgi:hypothetical protein